MSRHPSHRLAILATLVVVVAGTAAAAPPKGADLSNRYEALHAIDSGLSWLGTTQLPDGSWSQYPAITAMVVTAYLRRGDDKPEHRAAIDKGLAFVLGNVRQDGGIYPEGELAIPAMNTALCMVALVATKDEKHHETLRRARQFLIAQQCDEARGYQPDSCLYGGIGYGDDGRPDLGGLHYALEALKATEYLAREPEKPLADASAEPARLANRGESSQGLFWDKAIVFLQRCQNSKATNDQAWAGDDGGFIYNPLESKAGGHTSYGSMTYAGMKSLVYANLAHDDPRVRAAAAWCASHYTMDENPEMGQQGLYYYYNVMAKALDALGTDVLVDREEKKRRWRDDLIVALVTRQATDGSWVNANGRWWENNKDLATAHAVLALQTAIGR